MKKMLMISLSLLALLVLSACGDDVAVNGYDESKTSATLDLSVEDAASNMPLDSVEVSWIQNGKLKTATTDSNGVLLIKGLTAGSYTFTLTKEGYAEIKVSSSFVPVTDIEMPVIPDKDMTLSMNALGVTVEGQVKLQNIDGQKLLVDGATVELVLNGSAWAEPIFTTTTDENGAFSFSNLPERTTYSVTIHRHAEDGVAYKTSETWTVSGLRAGESQTKTASFLLTIEAPELVVDEITDEDLSSGDTLEVVFSEEVDQDEIKLDDIEVTGSGNTVAVETKWSSNGKTLMVWPADGEWGSSGTYTIWLSLQSVEGETLNTSENFSVVIGGAAGTVSGFEIVEWFNGSDWWENELIDITISQVELKWDLEDGVAGYEIYRKDSDDDNFTLYATINDPEDSNYVVTGLSGDLDDGAHVKFMIVSFTGDGRSPFADAPVITLEDVAGPMITNTGAVLAEPLCDAPWDQCDNSLGATDFVLDTEFLGFTADIDTSVAPTLSTQSGSAKLGLAFAWTGASSGSVELSVLAGEDATSLAGNIDSLVISGLTDTLGNVAPDRKIAIELE